MAFIKRLGWYLVGVSIGLVFLAFILKKKSGEEGIDFCYLPNCRVLKDIRSKTFMGILILEKVKLSPIPVKPILLKVKMAKLNYNLKTAQKK